MAGGTHYVTIKMVVKVSGFFNFLLFLPILSVSFYIMMGIFDLAVFLQVLLKTQKIFSSIIQASSLPDLRQLGIPAID